jgi:TonB family protein
MALNSFAQDNKVINDRDIAVSQSEPMEYPPLARTARVQGIVVVRVKLDKTGKVVEAAALSGHPLLTAACLDNAMTWQFRPNIENAVVIVYNFRMLDGECLSKRENSFSFVQGSNLVNIVSCQPVIESSSSKH